MGGHLDSMIDNAAAQAGYIQAGKVRGLFVTSKYRVAAYPDVPTAEEAARILGRGLVRPGRAARPTRSSSG